MTAIHEPKTPSQAWTVGKIIRLSALAASCLHAMPVAAHDCGGTRGRRSIFRPRSDYRDGA